MEVRTSDLYEAAYYLERGCRLEAVEKVKLEGGRIDCVFVIEGNEEPLVFLMARWSRGNTDVNLHAFRSAYAQVSGYVHRAKRTNRLQDKTGGGV